MKNDYEVRGDVTAIFLRRRDGTVLETLIDTSDLEKVKGFEMTWYAVWDKHTSSYYCSGNYKAVGRKQKKVKLHRYITDCPDGLVVDHENHDTLDNRRDNLRVVNHNINAQNRKNVISTNKSGEKGVSWDNKRRGWLVSFCVNGNKYYFGRYNDLEEARNKAREEYNKIISGNLADYDNIKRNPPGKSPSSGINGITWSKEKEKWRLYFKLEDKPRHFGYFEKLSEAAQEKDRLLSQKSS